MFVMLCKVVLMKVNEQDLLYGIVFSPCAMQYKLAQS